MSIPLFKATFKANWKLLLIFTSVMIFYSLTIMFMYDPVVIDSMEAMLKLLPQELIKAFGYQLQVPSYVGFLASYFLRISCGRIPYDFYSNRRTSA
jgi:ABC-2 type transport system permease protein